MATYFRPSVSNTSIKSTALSPYGTSGVLDPSLYTNDAWKFTGAQATLASSTVSGTAGTVSGSGYTAVCTDNASGAWLAQVSGPVVHLTSGGVSSSLAVPTSGKTFRGLSYDTPRVSPYLIASDGSVYAVSGTVQAATSFSGLALGLDSSGSVLFTLLPAAQQLGFLTLSGLTTGTSGSSGTPMTVPACLAASQALSAVAVGGWNFASLASGFSSLAMEPLNGLAMLGANPGGNVGTSGSVAAYGNASNTWSWTSAVTGLSGPSQIAWRADGLRALACSPAFGIVYALNYSLGVLTLAQTISVANAAAAAMDPNLISALVCRTASNVLAPMTFSGSTWTVSGTTIPIGSPSSILSTGPSGMVVGCASGLALANLNASGIWSIGASGSVGGGFTPTNLYIDPPSSGIYACGSSGASGFWSISTSGLALVASGSFTGAASGIIFLQGQTVAADAASGVLRFFGPAGSVYTQQNTRSGPPGLQALAMNIYVGGEQAVFAAGSAATWQMDFTAPYTLERSKVGALSIYNNGAWVTATFPTLIQPEALSWNPSGSLSVVTLNNTLYTYTSGAVFSASGTIVQFAGQPQTTPIGISALVWKGGHLFGATSLNDSVVEIV